MSSSTSSSDTDASSGWARWLVTYAATLAGGFVLLYLFVLVSDPFSTGRFTPFQAIDVAISVRTHANAGRVRDPSFDSAILGNSISTRFEPERLNALTGRQMLQLSIPGLGPDEQLAMARAFVRGRPHTKTIIAMLETHWCATDDGKLLRYPQFPHWLYESSDLEYLRNVLSREAVQAAFHRVAIRMGLAREPARRDGYVPGDQRGVWSIARVADLETRPRPRTAPPLASFPALDRFEAFAHAIDPRAEIVMVLLPFHVSALPEPGSPAAAWLEACKARIRSIVQSRPRTLFIDRMVEDDIARDANHFWDATHVRDHVVRRIEDDIAGAIRRMRALPTDRPARPAA
jgi:hypothetical protein